jgi:DNA processing protein
MIDSPPAGASASLPLQFQLQLSLSASAYPALLARIADPPPRLWLHGNPRALAGPCVALVGSRAASPYALQVAERLAGDLARVGVTVVSGLARGIDRAAHCGALTTGTTVAVLGSGVDVIYPPEHAPLADEIVARGGAIVSELAPGSPPRRSHFPRRNRLISGLSLAVVVIEASARSGSLQTARLALEQRRELLAVPGNILGDRFRGSHALLREGAKLVESASDILEELRLPGSGAIGPFARDVEFKGAVNGEVNEADRLLAAMRPGAACDLMELAAATGLPVVDVLRRLLLLEVEGRVVRTIGGRYIRSPRATDERAGDGTTGPGHQW